MVLNDALAYKQLLIQFYEIMLAITLKRFDQIQPHTCTYSLAHDNRNCGNYFEISRFENWIENSEVSTAFVHFVCQI